VRGAELQRDAALAVVADGAGIVRATAPGPSGIFAPDVTPVMERAF